MAHKLVFPISIAGFIFFASIGIQISQNNTYTFILKLLIGFVSVLFVHHYFNQRNVEPQNIIKKEYKPVIFNALNNNSEQSEQIQSFPIYQSQYYENYNNQSDSNQDGMTKEHPKKSDKESRKNNLKNYYQKEKDLSENNQLARNAANRQYFGFDNDSKSFMSQAYQTQYQIPISQKSSIQNEIQLKYKETEKILIKVITKLNDAHLKAEELLFKHFIPTFISEYQDHLINVNRMMKEHFQQKIIEMDVFFANKPHDINSNRHEKSIGLKSISLDDVFYLKQQIKGRERDPIRAPINTDKFNKDRNEFIKECDLLELFTDILDLSILNRMVEIDRKQILSQLVRFMESNIKPMYQTDGVEDKYPSDYEILYAVFINVVMKCVRYEKQKYGKETNNINFNSLSAIDVKLQTLETFGLEEKITDNQHRNIFLKQQFEQINVEPQFHYYSDVIVRQLLKNDDQKSVKLQKYILYTFRDQNSLNGLICYYLLHLLCLPKLTWQQLQQMDMDQKMIKCLIRMAKDISYLVTNL